MSPCVRRVEVNGGHQCTHLSSDDDSFNARRRFDDNLPHLDDASVWVMRIRRERLDPRGAHTSSMHRMTLTRPSFGARDSNSCRSTFDIEWHDHSFPGLGGHSAPQSHASTLNFDP